MKKLVIALVIGLLCTMTFTSVSALAANIDASPLANTSSYDIQVSYIEWPPPPIICAPVQNELAYIEWPPPPIICAPVQNQLAYIEWPPPPIICVSTANELV